MTDWQPHVVDHAFCPTRLAVTGSGALVTRVWRIPATRSTIPLEATVGRPYALYVHGNSDTTGAIRGVETIATGLRWNVGAIRCRSSVTWTPRHARPGGISAPYHGPA